MSFCVKDNKILVGTVRDLYFYIEEETTLNHVYNLKVRLSNGDCIFTYAFETFLSYMNFSIITMYPTLHIWNDDVVELRFKTNAKESMGFSLVLLIVNNAKVKPIFEDEDYVILDKTKLVTEDMLNFRRVKLNEK